VEVLKTLIDAMRRKKEKLWKDRSLINHDNAPVRTSLRVSSLCFAGKGISATDHPQYSPDLAPADFWLFPKLNVCAETNGFLDFFGH
jgi:hypothetical protein